LSVPADEQLVHIPTTSVSPTSAQDGDFQLRKWDGAEKAGFQLVPNVLFRAQKHLGLDSVDVVILLNLTLHWWSATNLPFPSPAMIANRMGLSRRTVERRIQALEKRKFLRRLPWQVNAEGEPQRRRYELSGFIERLKGAAMLGLAQRDFVKRQHAEKGLSWGLSGRPRRNPR
jgi:hypothetical protein